MCLPPDAITKQQRPATAIHDPEQHASGDQRAPNGDSGPKERRYRAPNTHATN